MQSSRGTIRSMAPVKRLNAFFPSHLHERPIGHQWGSAAVPTLQRHLSILYISKGHGVLRDSKERAELHNGGKLGRLWAFAQKLSAQVRKSPDASFAS